MAIEAQPRPLFVVHDVARVFRDIATRLREAHDLEAWKAWWAAARDWAIHDVQLLDQLFLMACGASYPPPPRSLEELAEFSLDGVPHELRPLPMGQASRRQV
jgi:hypothetical protein